MREIFADNESTDWVASLLQNMAVPGLLVTPKGDAALGDDVEVVKAYISSRFTGSHRGEPMVMGAPTDVQKISHSPAEMDMAVVHNMSEERVSAVLGVPAAVVGFGTGLENSKVGATMREFVGLAWSDGLIPPQRIMASELEHTLLPRFIGQRALTTPARHASSALPWGGITAACKPCRKTKARSCSALIWASVAAG